MVDDPRIERYPLLLDLVAAQRFWFSAQGSPGGVLRSTIPSETEGIYCLWWKDKNTLKFPIEVSLTSGKRGIQKVNLQLWMPDELENMAVYVGKGNIQSRILSHIKKSATGRNPYSWLELVFPGSNPEMLIKENMGFSYIVENNKLEQVYTENLAIGVLRPWFNLRLTA